MSMIELQRGHWDDRDDDCGCGEGLPNLDRIRDCWRQINELKHIIREILEDMGGPVKTGPIAGVVNGSAAKAGQVGEVQTNTLSGTFTADEQQQNVNALVLPPGDWDVDLTCTLTVANGGEHGVRGGLIELSPVPPGVGPMEAEFYGVSNVFSVGMQTPPTQVNVTIPTLMNFSLTTNDTDYSEETANGGTWEVTIHARRMR